MLCKSSSYIKSNVAPIISPNAQCNRHLTAFIFDAGPSNHTT